MRRTDLPPEEHRAGARRDAPLGIGVSLVLLGLPLAWFGWLARPYEGIPWFAVAGGAAAIAGAVLAVLRAREMGTRRLMDEAEADRNPLSNWEARHPVAAPLAVAVAAAAVLAFIAIRKDRPPFLRPDPTDGPGYGYLDPSWLAAVLWALAGGIATALVVESSVRRRSVDSVASALARGAPVLAATAALAVGYFLALGLPPPVLGEPSPWRVLSWVAFFAWGLWHWCRELQWHLRERPESDLP